MNNSILFQYITELGPVVYFSGNNGLFTELAMMDKKSKQDEIDFEELLEEHLIQYFNAGNHEYIYYRIGGEDSNCQLGMIKGITNGYIRFNYETEFSKFSKTQITDSSEYNDLIIIFPNNIDVVYGGTQELKTVKMEISFEKNKKMKKIDTGKNKSKVEVSKLNELIKE